MSVRRLFVGCGVLLSAVLIAAQEPADRSLAALQPADGLAVTLWASEPMFSNPTNLAIDERGRVWVLEAVNYRRQLRNQPDLRPEGDRIVILEDTDRDGSADTSTVFDQGPHLRAPLGIAVLGDHVYVSQSPDLIVYTKDAQDRIVSREVLLTGFGGVDHDHGLHAVVFGPDGRFYFNHGNTGFRVTDRSGRTLQGSSYLNDNGLEGESLNRPDAGYFQGVALRMNPDGTNLEVLAQNFRNPYEIAVDSFGNVFQTDNDDDGNAWTRLAYVVEGGNYGYRGPLHLSWNTDRGGHFHNELPGVMPNVLRLGAGSPCGLLVYEGGLLPTAYRGVLLHAEAGKRMLAGYPLTMDGAGFSATIEPLVYGGPDTWFRPSDVAVAPDGSVFVADWYDPGVGGHNMGDPDGGRGRIFRLAPPGHQSRVPSVDLGSDLGLALALASPNQAVRYLAHRAIVDRGEAAVPMLQQLWRQAEPVLRARALWILGGLGQAGREAIAEALDDHDPAFRILGLRVSRHVGADMFTVVQPLVRDPSPQVRREIAVMLRDPDPIRMIPPYLATPQTQPSEPWMAAFLTLAEQVDPADRWALEALGIAARGREDAVYARLAAPTTVLTSEQRGMLTWVLRPQTALSDLLATAASGTASMRERELAIDALGSMQWPEAARGLEAFIRDPRTPADLAARAFAAYSRQTFGLWADARDDEAFPAVVRRALAIRDSQAAAVDLVLATGDTTFVPDLVAVARSAAAGDEARAAAIEAVATTGDAQYLPDFRALAADAPTLVRVSAVRAAASLPQDDLEAWAQDLLLGDAPNEVRVEALQALGRSVEGLDAILDLAEAGQLPSELTGVAASLTNGIGRGGRFGGGRGRGFARAGGAANRGGGAGARGGRGPDPALAAVRERAALVLPLGATVAGPLPSIQQLERDYTGDVAAGRRIFEVDAGCAACHSLGGAPKAGPDLAAIGAKYGKAALLDQIVRPSDAIAHEYMTQAFELSSGDLVAGVVHEETPAQVSVITAAGETRRLATSEIVSRRESRVSLMPEGLLDAMSLQQIADLLQFLSTLDGAP